MALHLATRLWDCARRDLVALLTYVDESEVSLASKTLLGFTGGPTADFNLALIDACSDDEALFVESVELAYATTFFLIATPAGKPLYESVGFSTVEEARLWVAGSEQPAH